MRERKETTDSSVEAELVYSWFFAQNMSVSELHVLSQTACALFSVPHSRSSHLFWCISMKEKQSINFFSFQQSIYVIWVCEAASHMHFCTWCAGDSWLSSSLCFKVYHTNSLSSKTAYCKLLFFFWRLCLCNSSANSET